MRESRRIDYSIDGPIAIIAMNRPPVNAIDHQMIDAIHDGLLEADANEEVRAVILTSALPGMFCGGMDLRMVAAGDSLDLRDFVYKFYMKTMDIQYAMKKPTIAAVNGPAIGAGFDLACMCDFRIMTNNAYLAESFINLGIIPGDGGAFFLQRLIGYQKAAELTLTGRKVTAEEALNLAKENSTCF